MTLILFFFPFSQEVIINFLVYYGVIKDVFNSDIAKEGDYKLLASRLQNFLICIEMFIAALAHQYSFPYSPFQINGQPTDGNWWGKFLAMLDMEDVRADLTEHFGVVGDRIVGSFRSQPTYMQYNEADHLLTSAQQPSHVVTVSRVKDYGTYSDRTYESQQKYQAIGKDNKNYRIANIEDKEIKESSQSDNGQGPSSRNTVTSMTQSTTSTSSFGINVKGLENDPINYRNPEI